MFEYVAQLTVMSAFCTHKTWTLLLWHSFFVGSFNFMRRVHHCDVSHKSLYQFLGNILKDSNQHMWEVCYDEQMLCSWNPDSENRTAQIFGATNFGVIMCFFFSPPLLFVIGVIDIIFLLEVVINTLVTGVLIVGCEISVDAFKTSDQPHFIAC